LNNLIGIIGGDLRIAYLAEMLANDGENVYTYAFEKYLFDNNKIIKCENLEEIKKAEKIITSIPLSKDGENINAPFGENKICIENIFKNMKTKELITGAVNNKIKELADEYGIRLTDLLECEELAILNAIPTAEGAIEIAMSKSKITLHDSNCLILGFGRIGKILAKMLTGIGANVYCEARKEKDIAKINSYSYNAIYLSNLIDELHKFDFIFNTIPYLILDDEKLKKVNKNCIIIDLASKPRRSRL